MTDEHSPKEELRVLAACWDLVSALTPEGRKRVAWWLLENADSADQGSIVRLLSFGERKINVIKALRAEREGLGLKEAKQLVESAPVVVGKGMSLAAARSLASELRRAGADVEVL